MTASSLQALIDSFTADVTFVYEGIDYIVIPENRNRFILAYGDEHMITCDSIDVVMNTPFFGGKALNEIAGMIKLT